MHSAGISLVDETMAEPEVPSEQEKQLTQGIQFAYTVPSNDTAQSQEVKLYPCIYYLSQKRHAYMCWMRCAL